MDLDRGLTWNDHIDSACSVVSPRIYALRTLVKYCSLEVLRMVYFGLIHPNLSYGAILWESSSKTNMDIQVKKKVDRTLFKLNSRKLSSDSFRELNLAILHHMYVFDVILHFKTKCTLLQSRAVYHYGIRGRETFRVDQSRKSAFEHLLSLAGVK